MDTISFTCRQVPRHVTYGRSLHINVGAHLVLKAGVFAMLDCHADGSLTKKYVIIERKYNEERNTVEYVCSCEQDSCIHVSELITLLVSDNDYHDETEKFEYQQLNASLIGVYCKEDKSFSILSETKRERKCLKCQKHVKSCIHVRAFNTYITQNGTRSTYIREQHTFESISTEKIPYSLRDPEDLKTFEGYVSHDLKYPTELIPQFDVSKQCVHGNTFNKDLTIKLPKAKIHLAHFSKKVSIHYRPAIGCECRQYYEGRSHLLLNLDNIHIFPYIRLFDLLHNIQENHFSLHGAHRSANNTRSVGDQAPLREYMYQKLRVAYNCFIRLLDLDFKDLYTCSKCGPDVDEIVMDGIAMGARQDLLPDLTDTPLLDRTLSNDPIKGSTIEQRVFVRNEGTRKLLSSYAMLSKGGRYTEEIQPLSESDYEKLCNSLSTNPSLQDVIREAGNPCPDSIRMLVGELSRDSATCGIIQIAGEDNQACRILIDLANGDGTDFLTTVYNHISLLQKSCSILLEFLLSELIQVSNRIKLLKELIISLNAPFTGREEPGDEFYGAFSGSDRILGFFPNHPLKRGKATYEADQTNERFSTGCRKQTKRHNTLNPGLFTMFCPHGVCLGFQLMVNAESPRVAFEIFVRRFNKIPNVLIYDNACKLHLYALKREPARFQNTRFMVDRLHMKRGHVGCSLGYSMDSYSADENIKELNSQVNEQANRDLRRLSTPAAFMSPENLIEHTKVFLAIRNMKKEYDV